MRRGNGSGFTILDDADRYPSDGSGSVRDKARLAQQERAQGLVSKDIVVLALALLGAGPLLALLAFVCYLWGSTEYGAWRAAAMTLTAVLICAAVLALVLSAYSVYSAVRVTRVIKAQGALPYDVALGVGAKAQLEAYNERELTYAELSAFRGLQGTYAPNAGKEGAAPLKASAQKLWGQLAGAQSEAPLFTLGYTLDGDEAVGVAARSFTHMLLAGDSGTGKTTAMLNVCRQLASNGGELRVIDMKQDVSVALSAVASEIADDMDSAVRMLREVEEERLRRMKLRVAIGARDYVEYVSKSGDTLPRLYVAIDELAELVSVARGKRNAVYARAVLDGLMRLARSEGIHIVAATQYVNATILPKPLTQQFSSRVYFGAYDSVAVRVVFGGRATRAECALLTGEPGTGLVATPGQPVRAFVAPPL